MPRRTRGTTSAQIVEAARSLRREPTRAEQLLWQALRSNQVAGLKFRRQHPIGPYILDFYCAAQSLAVEVDGGIHRTTDQQRYDLERTEYLHQLGIRVLRFPNEAVETSLDSVLRAICEAAGRRQ